MSAPLRVLVVEDEAADFRLLKRELERLWPDAACQRATSLDELADALSGQSWDILLSDYSLPHLDFVEVLDLVLAEAPELPLILVSGSVGEERAVELLKSGVWDFVLKDSLSRLGPAIEHALREVALRREKRDVEDALRKSESQFRRLVEKLPAITYVSSLEHLAAPIYVSPQIESLLGIPLAECRRTPGIWREHLHPEDRDRVLEELRLCAERGRRFACEYRMVKADGGTVWFRDTAEIVHDERDALPHLQGVMLDITESKETEERYQLFMDHAYDGISISIRHPDFSNPDGFVPRHLIYCNDRFVEMSGRTREELIACKNPNVFLQSHSTPAEYRGRRRALLEGRPVSGLSSWKRPDGRPNYHEWTAVPMLRGSQLYTLAIDRDVTERHRSELERQATVRFLRLANLSTDTRRLVEQATAFFQEASGCDAVGIRLQQGDDYPYYEARGFPQEFVLLENSLCGRDCAGEVLRDCDGFPILECMCGNIIRGRFDPAQPFFTEHGSFWTNCTTELLASCSEEDRQARTRNRCHGEGYESVALLPLRVGDDRLGLLQLNHRRRDQFSPEDIALWERLADYLGVALAKLRAEEALQESEERHRLLFETSYDAMVISVSPSWRFTQGNRAAVQMFRARDEADLVSRTPWEYAPERQPDGQLSSDKAVAMIETALREGTHVFEWYHRRLDGEVFPAQVHVTPLDLEGQTAVQATVRDVTKEKEAEAALLASEERYRALFEGAAEGILVPDVETRQIRYANPAMCRMLGYALEEMLQKLVDDLHPPEKRDFVLTDFAEHSSGGVNQSMGIPCLRKDGTIVYADITTSPVEFDGRPCLVSFFEDVTERLRLTADKEKLESQMRQTQKLEAIGSLAGGVAHDFNNILTGIQGLVEFAMDDTGDAQYEDLQQAVALIERASDLTKQLLAFSRKQALNPAIVELNQLIRDHLKMLDRLLGEDIETRFLPAPDLGHVKADAGQISQVLMNLIVNARDAMPTGGRLTIETANVDFPSGEDALVGEVCVGPHVRIAVSDTGTGMAAEVLDRVFEPFFTTKEQGRGTGMGLATVHGIVKQHGGDIRVHSEPGAGTTFHIYLPRVSQAGEEPSAPAAAARPGDEVVLVVEDEPSVRRVVRRRLEKWGYRVLVATDPADAQRVSGNYQAGIDLLLTDIVMPGGNGLDLYDALKRKRPDLKVIYMSGYPNDVIAQRGVLKGEIHYIEKPIRADVLASKLQEILG